MPGTPVSIGDCRDVPSIIFSGEVGGGVPGAMTAEDGKSITVGAGEAGTT